MAEYKRKSIKMNPSGMSLAYAPDFMPEDLFPVMLNTRFDRDGVICQRNRLKRVKDLSSVAIGDVFLIKRLTYESNDYRLIHIGSKLILHNLITDGLSVLDTTFANAQNSTSIIGIRPEESIGPYLYIANQNAFKKFSFDGDYVDVGINAPNSPCVAKVAASVESIIDEIDGTGYTAGGAAGVLAVSNRIPNTTTLLKLLFDSGSTGWASIVVNTFPTALQPRTILTLNDATIPVTEKVIVDDVLASYIKVGVATISSIKYDLGVTGDCTIQLSIVPEDLIENAILLLGGTEYVRVKAVIESITGGKNAIRVSTIGTFSAGATVSGVPSFRAYLQNGTYTNVNTTISTDALKIPFATAGTGYAQKVVALDLSRISNRPINENDIIRIAFLLSDTSKLEEGQVQLDLSATGGNFDNYIFYSFTPSSLTQSYKQLTASTLNQQQLIQRIQLRQQLLRRTVNDSGYLDRTLVPELSDSGLDFEDIIGGFNINPDIIPNELNLGDFQWSVLEIPVAQFLQNRVGSDASRTLKDISAIRFSFRVNGAIDCYVDSLSIGGTYDLNSVLDNEGTINNYYWTYRYRSSKTRAVSAFAPPNRNGLFIRRGRGELTFSVSPDSQVDKIDIYRFGGRLSTFYYIGTTANSSTAFFDELADVNAVKNPTADFNYYKPFTILDKSRKGTCDVIGTEVSFVSGDNFNTSWSRGSQIIINGVQNALYNSPSSTTRLSLRSSVGNLTGVSFYMPAPRLVGQTLPTIFGPYGEGNLGLIVFGLGNANAKGTVYWLDGNSPDTMHDINSLEITSPDEPLIDGCVFRNIPYIFTGKRGFALRPRITQDGVLTFYAEEVEGIRGVRGRGCIAISDSVYILGKDGIYRFDGGNVQLISHDIHPLFPIDSIDTNGYKLGQGSIINFQPLTASSVGTLSVYRNYLYFFHGNVFMTPRAGIFVYDLTRNKFISLDENSVFSPKSIHGDDSQYSDELTIGGANEYYKFTNLTSGSDVETIFATSVYTPSYDFGDSRILKEFYEEVVDSESAYDGDGTKGIEFRPFLDNWKTEIINVSHVIAANANDIYRKKTLLEFPLVNRGYNISFLIILWSDNSKVYELQPSYLEKVEKINHRYTDWSNGGFGGSKILKELIVEADTFGSDVQLDLEGDGGTLITSFIINHSGQKRVAYSIPDNYTILFRIRQKILGQAATNKEWLLEDLDIRFKEAPDKISSPSIFLEDERLEKKYLQRLILDADTNGNTIPADIESDEGIVVVPNIQLLHDGRSVHSYDFSPVTGYIFRLIPSAAIRIFNISWKYDLEPEGQKIWRTQPTTHDIAGYQFLREIFLALKSTTIVNLSVIIDGVAFPYQIDSTDGLYNKINIPMKAIKGKVFEYLIESDEDVVIAQKDCEVRVHSINNGQEVNKNPFGHLSRMIGTA